MFLLMYDVHIIYTYTAVLENLVVGQFRPSSAWEAEHFRNYIPQLGSREDSIYNSLCKQTQTHFLYDWKSLGD